MAVCCMEGDSEQGDFEVKEEKRFLPLGLSEVGGLGKKVLSKGLSVGKLGLTIAGKTTGNLKAFVGFEDEDEDDDVDEFGNPLSNAERIVRKKQNELLLTTREELFSQHPNKALSNLIEGVISTYIHAYLHTYINTYIHAYMHTSIHTYIHTYIYMYIYAS